MSIRACLAAAVKSGRVSQKNMEEYTTLLAQAEKLAAQAGKGGANSYVFATMETAKEMLRKAKMGKMATARQIMAVDHVWEASGQNAYGRFMGLLTTFGEPVGGKYHPNSIPALRESALRIMDSFLDELLPNLRTKWAGLQTSTATSINVIRELTGGNTGDVIARDGAIAYRKAVDWGLKMLKQHGVDVKHPEDFYHSQRFDPLALREKGITRFTDTLEKAWRDGSLKIRDPESLDGGEAFLIPGEDDGAVRQLLNKIWMDRITDGAATREIGATFDLSIQQKYGRRRPLEWVGDEAWVNFNREFGVGDAGVADLLTGHIGDLARDVAMVQVLGPNPLEGKRILLDMAEMEGMGKWQTGFLDKVYFHTSGQSAMPVNETAAIASQSVRSWLTSTQLVKAVLSQISDFGFARAVVSWNDLSTTRFATGMLKDLTSLKPDVRRKEALRLGLGLMDGIHGLHDLTREAISEVYSRRGTGTSAETAVSFMGRLSGKTAEFVLRVQGMAKLTQLVRNNVGVDFLTTHAAHADMELGKLPKGMKNFMEAHGITPQEWDWMRQRYVDKSGDVPILHVARMAREGTPAMRTAALKYIAGVGAESSRGAMEGNNIVRALMLGRTQPGEITGEALRFGFQYKSFPVGVLLMHSIRAMDSLWLNNGSQMFRGSYIAGLMVSLVPLGAIGIQLDHLISGRDPEDMTKPGFWGRAAIKAGVGGLSSDWALQATQASSGADLAAKMFVGSAPAAVADVLQYAGSNTAKALTKGEQSHFALGAVRLADRYSPDTIYSKLLVDRLVWDTLKRMSDPAAVRGFAEMERRAYDDYGVRHWYRPTGQPHLPQRGPDTGRATERLF